MTNVFTNARSHFSLGESLAEPAELVKTAAEAGYTAAVLCDTMTISGMPEFFTAAKEHGIKPIIGVRLRIVDELLREKKKKLPQYFIRVIITDYAGWKATLGLLTLSFDEEHFYEVPRLLLKDVVAAYAQGGAVLTLGDAYGAIPAGKGVEVAEACNAAGIALYADLTLSHTPNGIRQAREALELQRTHGVKLLLAPQAFYTDAAEAHSLDMMRAIAGNRPWDHLSPAHPNRDATIKHIKVYNADLVHIARALEGRYKLDITDLIHRFLAANRNTRELADLATFTWDKMPPSLPDLAADPFARLKELCVEGWKKRLSVHVFGHKPDEMREYADRLVYELTMIQKLGFSPYFLLVADIVSWAKSEGIKVGPGRGSVGGSLIAYLMGITDVDPIRFGLLFERFINPERIDLPDADLDFASMRREEVIAYIRNRYGDDYVAGVNNYNKMQAASALTDVCRMLKVETQTPFGKLVPKEHGISWSLEDAIAEVPDLAEFARKNQEVVQHALNVEGAIRNYGKHAAGVIVAGTPIKEHAVIERRGGEQVINWDKRLAEDFGLVKMDVLGLSTLDMLDIAERNVQKHRGIKLDLLSIPLDDKRVLEAFSRGETVGVFQFESSGMRKLLKALAELDTLTFNDLAIATALFRPGPMDSGLMEDFIRIKQGRRAPSYDHPSMEDALSETQGVMVYQEQVMQVARDFAGYSMAEADELRKIMGKKLKDKMKLQKEKFVDGAVALHGVKPELAGEIFDKIAKFAAYGFNKSHAVEYALISYQTMWVKQYYPVEFWAGVMTMIAEDRRDTALADMKRMGIELLPPDINQSSAVFEPLNDSKLLAPFSAVKGISERSANLIVACRDEHGPFTSFEHFEKHIGGRECNVTQRNKLNAVGAFARIEPGQPPANDASRRKDQIELMPGLVADAMIVDRPMEITTTSLTNLAGLINDYKACEKCDLKGLCHPKPYIHGETKAMIILDAPSFKEEAEDEMGHGNNANYIEIALEQNNLTLDDVYLTALIKSPKPKSGKFSKETLSNCPVWVEEEIRILKPPVIVLMGSAAFQHFFKGSKTPMSDNVGRIIYNKDYDANFLIGFTPGSIYHNPEKQDQLNEVIAKLVDILPV